MTNPLVSAVMPVFNRERSVRRAIDSVLAQSYQDFELIVVDDGSTDGTREVLESFGTRIRIIAHPHRGVYAARNAGVAHSRGELIAFIDSDDAWLPDRLAAQVPLIQSRREVGLVFGEALHVTQADDGAYRRGNLTCFRVAPPHRGRVAAALVRSNFVPTITVLVRRRCLEEIGGFVESMPLSADYLAWFRISLRHELDYVAQPVAEYTVHSAGISFDLGAALAARIQLFSDELRATSDPETRDLLRRLLFNLSLHLALAKVRGRARNTANALGLAGTTAFAAGGIHSASWTTAFAFDQMRRRTRRLMA